MKIQKNSDLILTYAISDLFLPDKRVCRHGILERFIDCYDGYSTITLKLAVNTSCYGAQGSISWESSKLSYKSYSGASGWTVSLIPAQKNSPHTQPTKH
jgi:hypothetical protein